jgi:hypothetical protein
VERHGEQYRVAKGGEVGGCAAGGLAAATAAVCVDCDRVHGVGGTGSWR